MNNAENNNHLETLPEGWDSRNTLELVEPVRVDRVRQVPKSGYGPAGDFPIIDQGQSFIAGWTDDESKVIRGILPLIIFGDHTRCLKFVDMPFALGADGTKPLKARRGVNARFAYYALSSLDIPSKGYSRHFSVLKEEMVPFCESFDEQRKIAAVLLKLQNAILIQERTLDTLRELKKATLHFVFTHGLRGGKTKSTDLGPIPEGWNVVALNDVAKIGAGGTPSRGNIAYWQEGTIPWVKTGEIDYCLIAKTEEHITQLGLKKSAAKLLPAGTLLLAMYGQGVTRGKVAILGVDAATNQACAAITPDEGRLRTSFLYHYLTWSYERLRLDSHGAQQPNLSAKILARFRVAFPTDIEEQKQVAAIFQTLDKKIAVHKRKRDTLSELFRATLNQLMTAQIRVNNLDIDTTEVGG